MHRGVVVCSQRRPEPLEEASSQETQGNLDMDSDANLPLNQESGLSPNGVVVKREAEKPGTKRNETRLPKLKRSLPSILDCKKNSTSNFTVVACSLACP